ncbi:F-box domain-containing protein [Mycena sanguinolenta]|uniref:F-box domain-containing protein n=1 Tax=Mycena sanguinolenta TaxID=230812 RepID=A0A8H6ZDT1_9AGAR|nr:F-box domain-containing protein [Mycena sanguinolenta]
MLDCMEADRARLLALEAQIVDLEHSLSGLRREKARIRARLDAYKYPVLTLPNEVTSEIFIHFLPIYPAIPPLVGLASPTCLTLVCHKWREVALTTPTLWRAIEFNDDRGILYEHIRRISDAWIGRSGSCLLSINIAVDSPDFLKETLTKSLAEATTRWEHLQAWIPKSSFPKIDSPMPLLRSLRLSSAIFEDDDDLTFAEVPPHFCTTATPQLRTVVLFGTFSSKATLPWAQLTCLTLDHVGVNRCVSILQQTPKLVQCTLHLYFEPHMSLDFHESPLSLPCLKSLTLDTFSQQVAMILNSFIVPSLCTLKLRDAYLGEDSISMLKSFISQSGCALQEVCIMGNTTTRHESYRSAFPSIPTFTFTVPNRAIDENDDAEGKNNSDSSDAETDPTSDA